MGLFGKLFGGGPRKPPRWARSAFGEDGARFDAFVAVVATVLADADHAVADDDIRTGSVLLGDGRDRVEWILETVAAECAAMPEAEWAAIVKDNAPGAIGASATDETDDETDDDHSADDEPTRAWVIGTAPWGGVVLEAGDTAAVVIILPIADRVSPPSFPPGLAKAVVACNAGSHGHLAASAIARAVGVDRVLAVDPARPVDPAPAEGVTVEPLTRLEVGALRLEPAAGGSVLGRWRDGQTVLVGDAIPLSVVAAIKPHFVVGKLVVDDVSGELIYALGQLRRVVVLATVPGLDATALAQMMSMMGVTAEIAHGASTDPALATSRKLQILAHMVAGELDRADAIARAGIEANDDADEVAEMRYQGAMIALMRGDDVAALAALDGVDTPHALTSRATIAGVRGDPDARALARAALDRLPRDPVAIRSAISIHVFARDLDTARSLLAAHGDALDIETRTGLERAIANPEAVTIVRRHTFPAHAQLAMEAIVPLVNAQRFDEAEPMLRRVRDWDPSNHAITAELGFVLAQQGKLDDAIAVYDDSIARGGSAELLRFNRGNCRLRLGRAADAIADFHACLDLKADWHEVRVNLASALASSGDRTGATAQLAELKQRAAPPHLIAAVEQLLT